MKKRLATVLAAAMLLSACGSSDSGTYDPKNFKDYFVKGSDVESWNYLNSSAAVNTRVLVNLVSGLTDTDRYGNIVGDMAESWEPNEDYTVWTFHLRDGIKWYNRDGSEYAPVVAQDWVTALQWELTASNASTCTEMATSHIVGAEEYLNGDITDFSKVGVSAPDEKTVVFTLKNPAPWFDSVTLYNSFFPLNADFLAEQGEKFGTGPDTLLYNGAYLLPEYSADSEKLLSKNENYWDVDNVNIDSVKIIAVKDVESTKELFERGELSYCILAGTQPQAAERDGNEYMFKTDPVACSYVFFLNNRCVDENTAKAIQNENFRKAIFYGWDREEYVAQTDPLDPESIYSFGYTAPNFVANSEGTDFTQIGKLKDWQTEQYDLDLGKQYMAKAKEELGDTVTWPVAIPYYYKSGNETAANSAIVLKATFEEAFPEELTLDLNEYSQTFLSDVSSQNKQGIAGAGWIPDYRDPANQLGSIVPGPGGYMNNTSDSGYSHWDYPEFVAMFDAACAEVTDLDKRYEMFADAEAYLLEHAYYIPLYYAGAQYKMSSYNEYSRTYSKTGGTEYRYKLIEASEEAITAEQMAQYKADWEKAKAASVAE